MDNWKVPLEMEDIREENTKALKRGFVKINQMGDLSSIKVVPRTLNMLRYLVEFFPIIKSL